MKKLLTMGLTLLLLVQGTAAQAATVPRWDTPSYRVAFYAHDGYHMQSEDGKRSGYGYEMMETLGSYLQCTFSYVGYDKTPAACEELLRTGEIDLYTAAKWTEERAEEFTFSRHPSITATTYLTTRLDNDTTVAGAYDTYDGLRIGLLLHHTYNEDFMLWADERGFSYDICYFDTQQTLTEALMEGEIDAQLSSYISLPKDEAILDVFSETPYYIMARKENQELIDSIDSAMDRMNVEHPNWRTNLYQTYYGAEEHTTQLTAPERALLNGLQHSGVVIRGLANPDNAPYSWYENGEAHGIAVEMFRETAAQLGLDYEILPAETREDYQRYLLEDSDQVDIWLEVDGYSAKEQYKLTDPYLETTVSLLRRASASGKIQTVGVVGEITIEKLGQVHANWPNAKVVAGKDLQDCVDMTVSGEVDGVLLMTFTAQRLVQNDLQNRLRADIVPGTTLNLSMGIHAQCDRYFRGLWNKTLERAVEQTGAEVLHRYTEGSGTTSVLAFLFDNPGIFASGIAAICVLLFFVLLYLQARKSNQHAQRLALELEEALEQAQKATRAKEDFFSKMSHDIRTPLNVVLGMTQVAQKYRHEPERLQYALDNITAEGNYLLVLINSILDVNQLEHGCIELAREPFDPAACVQANAEMLRALSESKSQNLIVTCPPEGVVMVGDVNRFSQIIINIVSNAIKYTAPGGQVHITLDYLSGTCCRFTCADNGIGMTEEFVSRITEEYSRAEDSRVSKTQGTGLGMAVVKGFLERMGGTLQIQTELEHGSTFIVELPFEAATPAQRDQVLHPVKEEGPPAFAGKRVLLVEDNALNAEIATELLQSIELEVDWAENGRLALNRLMESQPGTYFAIFMDMQMPVMDGVTATREIRACAHPDHAIPIFAMTANTFAEDRKRCSEAGMNGYLSKPIRIDEIRTVLNQSVENREQGGDSDGK